jgi:hypothetical protein
MPALRPCQHSHHFLLVVSQIPFSPVQLSTPLLHSYPTRWVAARDLAPESNSRSLWQTNPLSILLNC